MIWFTSKNQYIDKILIWIEDNILDRVFWKRILRRIKESMESGFVNESVL